MFTHVITSFLSLKLDKPINRRKINRKDGGKRVSSVLKNKASENFVISNAKITVLLVESKILIFKN